MSDFFYFAKSSGEFVLGVLLKTAGHRGEDSGFGVEPGADNKRKAEARKVGGVEALKFSEFGVGEAVEAGAGLFAGGFGG